MDRLAPMDSHFAWSVFATSAELVDRLAPMDSHLAWSVFAISAELVSISMAGSIGMLGGLLSDTGLW